MCGRGGGGAGSGEGGAARAALSGDGGSSCCGGGGPPRLAGPEAEAPRARGPAAAATCATSPCAAAQGARARACGRGPARAWSAPSPPRAAGAAAEAGSPSWTRAKTSASGRPRARRRAEPQARAPRQRLDAVERSALVADAPTFVQEQPRSTSRPGGGPSGRRRRELARATLRRAPAATRRALVRAARASRRGRPSGPVPPVRGRGGAAHPAASRRGRRAVVGKPRRSPMAGSATRPAAPRRRCPPGPGPPTCPSSAAARGGRGAARSCSSATAARRAGRPVRRRGPRSSCSTLPATVAAANAGCVRDVRAELAHEREAAAPHAGALAEPPAASPSLATSPPRARGDARRRPPPRAAAALFAGAALVVVAAASARRRRRGARGSAAAGAERGNGGTRLVASAAFAASGVPRIGVDGTAALPTVCRAQRCARAEAATAAPQPIVGAGRRAQGQDVRRRARLQRIITRIQAPTGPSDGPPFPCSLFDVRRLRPRRRGHGSAAREQVHRRAAVRRRSLGQKRSALPTALSGSQRDAGGGWRCSRSASRRLGKPKCSPRHRALMADITLEGWVPLSQAAPLRYLRMRAVEKNSAKQAKRFPLPPPATPPTRPARVVPFAPERLAPPRTAAPSASSGARTIPFSTVKRRCARSARAGARPPGST